MCDTQKYMVPATDQIAFLEISLKLKWVHSEFNPVWEFFNLITYACS